MCNRRRKEPSQLCTKCCCAIDPTIRLCAEVCQAGTQPSQFNRLLCRTTTPPANLPQPDTLQRCDWLKTQSNKIRRVQEMVFLWIFRGKHFAAFSHCCCFCRMWKFSQISPSSQAPTDAFVTSNNWMSIKAASLNETRVDRHTLVEQWNGIQLN